MIDWSLPYASNREAVLGEHVVACSQPLASQAGIEMMKRGGNAVDAAIAAAIVSTVVEPCANGIGGDAFAIVHDGDKLYGLNASGKSPALMPTSIEGEIPSVGWLAVTVPGQIAGWVELHERFGTLTFAELFEPAIRYARDGFLASPQTATRWKDGTERFRTQQAWCDTFLFGTPPVAPEVGELVKLPDHARTLQEIAETNGESFYRGKLAAKIDEAARADGPCAEPVPDAGERLPGHPSIDGRPDRREAGIGRSGGQASQDRSDHRRIYARGRGQAFGGLRG